MFPAFLRLTGRRVVVVGGGPVAAGKLDALLEAGADVLVVAPDVRPEIEQRPVRVERRPFEDRDLDGAWWVVAAAPPEVNARVVAAAESRRVFVNAVDDPAHATAYAGGVVRRAGVTIAISTNGRAPAMAGLLREALDALLPGELDAWMDAADQARRQWKSERVPMEARRPQLLEALNALYETKTPDSQLPTPKGLLGSVSLVGAGPGDPQLWTLRAVERVKAADLILYDALVDVEALRKTTSAQLFCVGKRARRDSVPQETIHRLMIRAARQGKRVVRLKGGDPFVFGRGAEEALALAHAGVPCEVVPGVTTAVAAAELAGIPVTHRGVASGFLVMAGHTADPADNTLQAIRPNSISVVVMMGVGARAAIAARLIAHGWKPETPAAIVCSMSTPQAWTWTGRLDAIGSADVPAGAAGVLIVGEVVRVREALAQRDAAGQDAEEEVKYGRH
jgi:uroporphyrin-III C-methyltransferase/precorrin-2 dehydrogenase/sirohydrochlorin ferrochelatase